ncbi:hypothetical protein, partial [Demequina sp.]|uniref:hypothetical protein n=1 Tax=Demequina sp. TaxID=2050685 RepID=UPI0025BBE18C
PPPTIDPKRRPIPGGLAALDVGDVAKGDDRRHPGLPSDPPWENSAWEDSAWEHHAWDGYPPPDYPWDDPAAPDPAWPDPAWERDLLTG